MGLLDSIAGSVGSAADYLYPEFALQRQQAKALALQNQQREMDMAGAGSRPSAGGQPGPGIDGGNTLSAGGVTQAIGKVADYLYPEHAIQRELAKSSMLGSRPGIQAGLETQPESDADGSAGPLAPAAYQPNENGKPMNAPTFSLGAPVHPFNQFLDAGMTVAQRYQPRGLLGPDQPQGGLLWSKPRLG